jgi:hypothetical protein
MGCSYERTPAQECSDPAFVKDEWGQKAEGDDAFADLTFLRL